MTTHVQDKFAPNASGSAVFVTSIGGSAGDAFICYMTAWMSGNNPVAISSITDNASGGTNVWRYSTAQQSQFPPAAGSFSVTESQYGFTASAVCLPSDQPTGATKAFTQVTVTFSAAVSSFGEVGVSEFSNVPAGAVLVDAKSSNTLAAGVSSYTTPSVTVPGPALVVANNSYFNTFTGVTSGYTLLDYADPLGAYDVAAPAGSASVTFSGGTSGDVPSSCIVAICAAATPKPLVVPSQAAIQAACW